MIDLSPQAQAVWDTFLTAPMGHGHVDDDRYALAAVLRNLDSQLGYEMLSVRCVDCSQLQLIANELEGLQ